jgi:sRNA-binding regulator protein Hfq
VERRRFSRDTSSLSAQPRSPAGPASFSEKTSRAETFYLQKQAHSQTLMVFVLDDGEQIGGYIEWYDKDVIKVRHGGRTLIYKSSIKYLYKAEENISI